MKMALSGSGVVDSWRVAGAALAALETVKTRGEALMTFKKYTESGTYALRAAKLFSVDSDEAVESG